MLVRLYWYLAQNSVECSETESGYNVVADTVKQTDISLSCVLEG